MQRLKNSVACGKLSPLRAFRPKDIPLNGLAYRWTVQIPAFWATRTPETDHLFHSLSRHAVNLTVGRHIHTMHDDREQMSRVRRSHVLGYRVDKVQKGQFLGRHSLEGASVRITKWYLKGHAGSRRTVATYTKDGSFYLLHDDLHVCPVMLVPLSHRSDRELLDEGARVERQITQPLLVPCSERINRLDRLWCLWWVVCLRDWRCVGWIGLISHGETSFRGRRKGETGKRSMQFAAEEKKDPRIYASDKSSDYRETPMLQPVS